MKKIFSILLAVAMLLALAVPAMASGVTDETTGQGQTSQGVEAQYQAGQTKDDAEDVAKVYLVTVEWTPSGNLAYYDGTTTYEWNAADTQYEEVPPTDQAWTGEATVAIKVTNQSNDAVTATATWKNADTITAAQCQFTTDGVVTVKSAAEDIPVEHESKGEAQSETITATINSSTITGTISEQNKTVGTITVAIAPAA